MNKELLVNAVNNLDQTKSEQPSSTLSFDKAEQNLISWFFATVRVAWGAAKFNSQFGEGEDVVYAKRYWGKKITKYSRVQLAGMLDAADRQRIAGNQKFLFPDIAQILSLTSTAWESRAHLMVSASPQIEDQGAREKRVEYGKTQCASLLEMLKS